MLAIVNASPLIYLSKLGVLDKLKDLYTEIFTTEIVKKEVLLTISTPEKMILEDAFDSWLTVKNVEQPLWLEKFKKFNIHYGEASILALAKELDQQDSTIILDDFGAREIARSLNFRVIGTLGILLFCAKKKVLDKNQIKIYLKRLSTETNFRVSTKLFLLVLDELEKL